MSHLGLGNTPAARKASCRSQADTPRPSRVAASINACFSASVTRMQTTSSLGGLGLGAAMKQHCNTTVCGLQQHSA